MDIKRAKNEIKHTIEAYLARDAFGDYQIPTIHQRPILLIGPPGIGKTQIMEQVARECGIALVSYTITHHTRQSAIGLPFIKEREYGGKTYSVTEYTMSEIIASVYEKMEQTGLKEGILFIDEINCVSETLAPAMLQFLQCKTFGNHAVPEGWIIVAAGNPPEYNKSVREFDVVTLDRVKRIQVVENLDVWKTYAYTVQIHPAILSYLELRQEFFYKIETTVDGKQFVTARGWEDLSRLLKVYETLGKKADREVIHQYLQHWKIAKDFANYLELYQKYQKDYGMDRILEGVYSRDMLERLKFATFDERLSVVGMLSGKLSEQFQKAYETDQFVTRLFECLKRYRERKEEKDALETVCEDVRKALEEKRRKEQLTKRQIHLEEKVLETLEAYQMEIKGRTLQGEAAFDAVRELFSEETQVREDVMERTASMLDAGFDFMEDAFGESQEMVVFVTELNTNFYSIQYLKENVCGKYQKYNKGLLFDSRREEILEQMEEADI